MNANIPTRAFRNQGSPASLHLLSLAAGVLFAMPPAQAEVQVDDSLVAGLPQGYAEVRVGQERYYTQHGVFYQRGPRGYVVVRAPRGAILRSLPPHYARIQVGSATYCRYGDVYYQPVRDGYRVVDAPVMLP